MSDVAWTAHVYASMFDYTAPCPACARTLRLVRFPASAFVRTTCAACGEVLVLAYAPNTMTLMLVSDASRWRFRRLLVEQGLDIGLSAGSLGGTAGVLAVALVAGGQLIAGSMIGGIAVIAAGGGGVAVALDAFNGAAKWCTTLPREGDLLMAQPDGYRA
ncbi:MAG TPA: hypothetical protein VH054_06125 [Polyangiaceae bacterium]|nr:hypothetical protein [Polyangiaceae bacterium]